MLKILLNLLLLVIFLSGCNHRGGEGPLLNCADSCMVKAKDEPLVCTLSSPELRKRKETVIAGLKARFIEKRELKDGYAFKFTGDDNMVDQLMEFIKSERQCCGFFTFTLTVSGDKSEAWLALTGPVGTKLFIESEVGL